jgi:hypothetical protein
LVGVQESASSVAHGDFFSGEFPVLVRIPLGHLFVPSGIAVFGFVDPPVVVSVVATHAFVGVAKVLVFDFRRWGFARCAEAWDWDAIDFHAKAWNQ